VSACLDPHNNLVVKVLYGLDPHNNLANLKKGRFLMFQTVHLKCHKQRSFTLKMHQNRWRLELCPRPHWGAYIAPPDFLAGLRGPTSKERGGEGRGEEGKGRDFGPSQCWRQIDAPDWKFGSHTYDGHRQYFRVSVHSSLE